MTTEDVEQFISLCESEFFTGTHSEGFITKDLQTRKTSDTYSTMGSNPCKTSHVWEKKQVYFETFEEADRNLNIILSKLKNSSPNHAWISRCERCKNQIAKLRNLVRDFQ